MRKFLAIGLLSLLALATVAAQSPRPRVRALVLREKKRWAAADVVLQRVQFSPDGRLLVSASGGGEAATWTLDGEPRGHFFGQRSPMFNAVFTPSGDALATTGYDGTVRLWSLPAGETFRLLNLHHPAVNDVTFCGVSDRVVSGSDEGLARLWDIKPEKPAVLQEVRGAGTVRRVACSPVERIFANTFDSGEVQVTTFAGKQVARFDTGQDRINAIAISRDGKRLLTGSTDGTIKLWTTAGHLLFTRRVQDNGWVNDARFSPDGRWILVATDDGHVRIYDLSGALLADLAVTTARATTAAFSPDGSLVAGGTSAGEMFLFEVAHE
jgi:WD40 repeat protein